MKLGIGIVLGLVALAAGTEWLLPGWGPTAAVIGSVTVLLLAGRHWKDLLWKRFELQKAELAEVRAHLGLLDSRFATPLPWSGWSLRPSAVQEVVQTVDAFEARCIVECGCGVSTLYLAHALKVRGHGRVIALEHDAKWAGFIEQLLERYQLQGWVTVLSLPLTEREFYGRSSVWYSIEELPLRDGERIDVLLVDGPPEGSGKLARLGAVPFCWPWLADDAIVFLDDARRPEEQEIVDIWCREHPLQAADLAVGQHMRQLRRQTAQR